MTIGRCCARSQASRAVGEGPSVRITLPIDMKKLVWEWKVSGVPTTIVGAVLPYPNVAPDPSIYFESNLKGPSGPPP